MDTKNPRAIFAACLCVAFVVASVAAAAAQVPSSRPLDLVVALDVSGSMAGSDVFASVKAYLEKDVLRPLLKPGDRFTLILFGKEARTAAAREIARQEDVDAVVASVAALRADDGYTDLGAALEALDSAMAPRSDGLYRTASIFITDGKNAPPPGSPFFGKDLSVDERFAGAGRRIARKGWILYVVGLGAETDAPAVAAAVEGSVIVEAPASPGAASSALAAAPLGTYLAETATAAEERAASAASAAAPAAAAAAAAGSPAGGTGAGGIGSWGIGGWVFSGAAVIAAALGAILVARRRKSKGSKP